MTRKRWLAFAPALGVALALMLVSLAGRAEEAPTKAGDDKPDVAPAPDAGAAAVEAPPEAPPEKPEPEKKAPPAGGPPQQVHVGLYLKALPDIDIKSNTYLADFYLWFR